jgi:hypothetical protein
MVAAAVATWWPGHVAAALCGQPAVSGVSPQVAAPGDTVTISGANFTSIACSTSANIGGVNLTQNQMSVHANTISFTAQPGMHGGVQVSLTDISNNSNASNANVAFYTAPTVSGLSTGTPSAGQGVTVGGSGFAFLVPGGEEHLGAAYLSSNGSTCAGASASLSSDSAIAVSAPGHFCYGPLALSISAPADLSNPASLITVYAGQPGTIDVQATGVHLSSTSVVAGSPVNVEGSGFGTAGSATVGGAGVPSSWSDTSVAVTVPDTAVNNSAVLLKRADDGAGINGGAVNVVARVDAVTPSSASPGDTVTISGGGFGTNPGTVTLGSTKLTVSSWSPTSIAVTLPPGAQSGALTISPVDTGAPGSQPGLTVVQKLSVNPTSGGSASSGSHSAKPLTPDQLQQVTSALSAPPPPLPPPVVGGPPPSSLPPTHPTNGLVALALKATNTTAAPGKNVPFTVTLKAAGNPVANAAVQMVIAYEPAADGSVSPTSGVTNNKGEFHGTIHLSKTPGEMIVLARAGEFSDEVRVLGSSNTAAHTGGGTSAAGAVVPLAIVVLAVLLILAGIGLRLWLIFGPDREIRTALLKERVTLVPMMLWRRMRLLAQRVRGMRTHWSGRPSSGRDVQQRSDATGQAEVTAEAEPAVGLDRLRTDAAPDESKERIEVHP